MRQNCLLRHAHWVLIASVACPATAWAQFAPSPFPYPASPATVSPLPPSSPADRLAANLLILAQNPRDVIALTDAGKGALAIGDGNAALSFFARAEDLSPGDSRIKAGLGTALLLMEEPTEALKLYSEASALGLPDREFARDRGLAYDLIGDPRRAQRDYANALRVRDDPEVTRRLALSLGITGDRDQGLKLLDPLLKKQDQAAWRARAFILAMNGNMADAQRIVEQVMPLGMAGGMTPFLSRLASLTSAQRARAVNFGTMPDSGVRTAMIQPNASFRALEGANAARLTPVEAPPPVVVAEANGKRSKQSKASRRRPGKDGEEVALRDPLPVRDPSGRLDTRFDTRLDTRIAPVDPTRLPPEIRPGLTPAAATSATAQPKSVIKVLPQQPQPQRAPPPEIVKNDPPAPVFEIPSSAVTTNPLPSVIRQTVIPAAQPNVTIVKAPLPATVAVAPQPVRETVATVPPSLPPPPAIVRQVAPVPAPLPAVASEVRQVPLVEAPGAVAEVPKSVVASGPSRADAGLTPFPAQTAPASTNVSVPAPTPVSTPTLAKVAAEPLGLSAIIASIVPEEESVAAPLPTAAQLKAARAVAQKKAVAEAAAKLAKDEAAKELAEKAALAKRNPARVWVQVATGSNEAGLPGTWKQLKEKAPDVFKGQSASVVPYKATNRMVVGPFKSQSEARALVNAMIKAGLQGSTYASDAGQEVSRVGGK